MRRAPDRTLTSLAPLLSLADWHNGPALGAADLAALPAPLRSWALAHGVLAPIGCLDEIACPACGTHAVTPSDDLTAWCTAEGGRERLVLASDDFRAWEFSIEALAKAVADALTDALSAVASARVGAAPVVPGRIAFVATTNTAAGSIDLFVARGLNWPDASMILSNAQRLRRSPRPALLSLTRLAPLDVWRAMKPAVGSLAECAAIGPTGLVVDISSLTAQQPMPSPAALAPGWLTVKEAAVQLMDVVSGLHHDRAMARVSRAATDGKFRTNGKTRMDRRIDRDSLSRWLLEQRKVDLASADAWSSGG